MKRLLLLPLIVISLSFTFQNDEGRSIPSVEVQTMKGQPFDTKELSNDGDPFIINFWATWCKPCKRELNNISEHYSKWQEETGVKLVAISIDDARSMNRVAPYVNGKGWDYEVYLDPNQNFKRALNVNNPPHTFLVNGDGRIVWQHNGYAPGDEKILFEEVKKLIEKEEEDKE